MTLTTAAIIGGIGLLSIIAMLVAAVVGLGRAKRQEWEDSEPSALHDGQCRRRKNGGNFTP